MKCLTINFFRNIILLVLPFLFMMASCEEELVGMEKANTPSNNFELFWKTFNQHYGLFSVKQVDWDSIYHQYRPMVHDQMTDVQLYDVFKEMIVVLNDNHLNLYPTDGALPVFPGGVLRYSDGRLSILKVQEDYSVDVVKNYVTGLTVVSPNLRYGKLGGDLGYINISGTDPRKSVEQNMEKIMDELRETRSLIVDIRGHYGGFDAISQYIAGRFSDGERVYMTTRKRNGPGRNDFTAVTEWRLYATGSYQYHKPVIVLTSRFTQSAGETFALAMNELNHVTLLGDTTAGSFSDNPAFELYNGWMFTVSVGDYRAADGSSYEGKGIAPDIWAVTSKTDLLAGRDVVLERAIQLADQ